MVPLKQRLGKLKNWKETYIFFFYLTDKLNFAATAEPLQTNNCTSSNVILIFDEIYLQKCEEYFGGESFGTDETGNWHKGMTTFMNIGLTKNAPCVIHTVPENKNEAEWLLDELIMCSKCLLLKRFSFKACVCDNHPIISPPTENFSLDTEKMQMVAKCTFKISQYIYSLTLYTLSRTS